MRRAAFVVACVLGVGACGGGRAAIAPGCTSGRDAVVAALASAPGPVTLDGTPISRCFSAAAGGAEVQVVGANLTAAAQQLGDRARAGEREAALRLGYLVGAARRGQERAGTAAELLRRIESEANGFADARRAYERGLRAGLRQG